MDMSWRRCSFLSSRVLLLQRCCMIDGGRVEHRHVDSLFDEMRVLLPILGVDFYVPT